MGKDFSATSSLEEQMTKANVRTLLPDVCNQFCTEEATTYTRYKPQNLRDFA
jgi:hypothetical protein